MKKKSKQTQPIRNPKGDHIYYVSNKYLKIQRKDGSTMPGGHDVIVLSINKKNNTARVKTITSLEHETSKGIRYDFRALDKAKKGEILPIPIKDLNSSHYSGINHRPIIVSVDRLNKSMYSNRFPRRYKKLIHRK